MGPEDKCQIWAELLKLAQNKLADLGEAHQNELKEELEAEIQSLSELDASSNHLEVVLGSLILLAYQGNHRWYLVTPLKGGTMLKYKGEVVMIISAFSPLGAGVLGLKAGEKLELKTSSEARNYSLISVV